LFLPFFFNEKELNLFKPYQNYNTWLENALNYQGRERNTGEEKRSPMQRNRSRETKPEFWINLGNQTKL